MHFALEQIDRDVIVGDDPGEALGDAAHLKNGGALGHDPRFYGHWWSMRNRTIRNELGAGRDGPPPAVRVVCPESLYSSVAGIFTLPVLILPAQRLSVLIRPLRFGALRLTLP